MDKICTQVNYVAIICFLMKVAIRSNFGNGPYSYIVKNNKNLNSKRSRDWSLLQEVRKLGAVLWNDIAS